MIALLVEEGINNIRLAWPNGPWNLVALTPSGDVADSRIFRPKAEHNARKWMALHYRLGHSIICALPMGGDNGK